MKITSIEILIYKYDQHYKLTGSTETPGLIAGTDYFFEPYWRQAYSRKIESCVIKMTTDTGIEGWGEAQAPLLPETPASILQHLMAPFLIGQNPLERERIIDTLYHLNNIRGHGTGFWVDAIAGIDLALWDIAGKHHGVSVAALMGGAIRTELEAYVSGLRQPTLEEQCEAARGYMAEGYAGIKIFPGKGLKEDTQTIRAIREAAGPEAKLYCDVLWRYGLDDALRLGRVLEEEGYGFFEAPLPPEDINGHTRLAEALDVPLAVGEPMRTPWEFEPWFEKRALHVAQPDVGRTGLTFGRKIAAMAEGRRLPVAPHVGVCTGLAMAATWQFASAIPNFLIQEYQLELTVNANRCLRTPLEARGGKLMVPDRPGLGVEVDEDAIRASTVDTVIVR